MTTLHLIPFDAQGRCTAPQTREEALAAAASPGVTDVICFAHGWNNDWPTAEARYLEFIDGYRAFVAAETLSLGRPFKPVLVGFMWPSAAWVLPWEEGPTLAATPEPEDEPSLDGLIDDLVEAVPGLDRSRLQALAARPLDETQARELAALTLVAFASMEDGDTDSRDADDVLAGWSALDEALTPTTYPPFDPDAVGTLDDEPAPSTDPTAAGAPFYLLRGLLRYFTVWQMKDRAGLVGSRGGADWLADLATRSQARVALIGHSFGARLWLSALSARPMARPVASTLLLQPAVNAFAFAASVPKSGVPGGFRPALERVAQPLVTTFSRRDFALYRAFHLALRRKKDLGEPTFAAAEDSPYRALGGYGPAGLAHGEGETVDPTTPPNGYPLAPNGAARVVALRAHDVIPGHGAVANAATYWALFQQLRQAVKP